MCRGKSKALVIAEHLRIHTLKSASQNKPYNFLITNHLSSIGTLSTLTCILSWCLLPFIHTPARAHSVIYAPRKFMAAKEGEWEKNRNTTQSHWTTSIIGCNVKSIPTEMEVLDKKSVSMPMKLANDVVHGFVEKRDSTKPFSLKAVSWWMHNRLDSVSSRALFNYKIINFHPRQCRAVASGFDGRENAESESQTTELRSLNEQRTHTLTRTKVNRFRHLVAARMHHRVFHIHEMSWRVVMLYCNIDASACKRWTSNTNFRCNTSQSNLDNLRLRVYAKRRKIWCNVMLHENENFEQSQNPSGRSSDVVLVCYSVARNGVNYYYYSWVYRIVVACWSCHRYVLPTDTDNDTHPI